MAPKTVAKKSIKATKPEKETKIEKEKIVKAPYPASGKSESSDSVKKPKRKKKKQKNEDDEEPVIIEDILIEQLIQSTKRKAKVPKVPKILKTFVNPMASLTVAAPANNKKGAVLPKKEPKGKFELEYVVRTSAGILYELLTTPSGLSEWFADDVNIRDGIFTFFWDGSEQKARLLGFKEDQYIRMQWIDKPEGSFFEFRIQRDELTGDISLIIIDFADEASDMQTSKLLWDSQVNKLLNVLGSN
ncbi:MAG: START-like domain-containing protein [Bacteroidota bacterium]